MKKYIANLITFNRIILSIILIFVPLLSTKFYVLYLLSGLSDMADGIIARKIQISSRLGSILDSIADFVFFISCSVKILPTLDVPIWLWIWIISIFILKMLTMKLLVSIHTTQNKIMGVVLFLLPFAIHLINLKYIIILSCLLATFILMQELSAILSHVYNSRTN